MIREDFMDRLAFLLQDLDDADRDEALQYYNDYFEDAGEENEAQVIRELKSPERVAAIIKDGLKAEAREHGAYTDAGYADERFEEKRMPGFYQQAEREEDGDKYYYTEAAPGKKKKKSPWKVILIIALCLCGIPVFAPLALAVIVFVLALILGAAAVVLGLAVSGVAIVIAGFVALARGIAKLILVPVAGALLCGVALLIIAVGILVTWLIWTLFCKVASPMMNGLIRILKKPFERKGARS